MKYYLLIFCISLAAFTQQASAQNDKETIAKCLTVFSSYGYWIENKEPEIAKEYIAYSKQNMPLLMVIEAAAINDKNPVDVSQLSDQEADMVAKKIMKDARLQSKQRAEEWIRAYQDAPIADTQRMVSECNGIRPTIDAMNLKLKEQNPALYENFDYNIKPVYSGI